MVYPRNLYCPIWFNFFINGIDDGTKYILGKVIYDTKLRELQMHQVVALPFRQISTTPVSKKHGDTGVNPWTLPSWRY